MQQQLLKLTSPEKSTWQGESIRLIKKPGSFFCSPLMVLTSTLFSPLISKQDLLHPTRKEGKLRCNIRATTSFFCPILNTTTVEINHSTKNLRKIEINLTLI
ncbi:unnamed protein product [Cercopithifilaria johnstoni]|uniref:Uncharacterized protein n=1 Tax=Cercopithifilaria johnstoni TaxID=2874296 RepID=A0A8J2PVS4_9BILA|nr:unnamed protein product [Cercopithifilaria johnstoni]